MSKWSISLFSVAVLIALAPSLHAQALPTATKPGGGIQAGVGILFLDSDYNNTSENGGITVYGDYDVNRYLGADAEAHFGGLVSANDITENSYLVGPRVMYHRRKFTVYGKVLFGVATIHHQGALANQAYFDIPNPFFKFFTYGLGGGLEYKLKPRYNLRVDLEDQKWPSFEPHTLSPVAITVGVAYVFR